LLGERKQLLRPEGFISGEEDAELVPTTSLMPAKDKHEVAGSEQGREGPGLPAAAAMGKVPLKAFDLARLVVADCWG